MSCVVGIADRGTVHIVGDSGCFDTEGGNAAEVRRDPKVFARNGTMIFGCVGSYRMLQLVRFSLVIPRRKRGTDVFEFMATSFIENVRKCFDVGGFSSRDKEEGNEKGGCFLVGYQGRLFRVYDDFHVAETASGFDAIGVPEPALGALVAQEIMMANARRNKHELRYDARDRAFDALRAAEMTTNVVRKPFVCVTLPRKQS